MLILETFKYDQRYKGGYVDCGVELLQIENRKRVFVKIYYV